MNFYSNNIPLYFSFWLSDEPFTNFFLGFLIIQVLVTIPGLLIIENLNSLIEKIWSSVEKRVFDIDAENFFDTGSPEKGFAQIVKDVKTKFEDVAGNEEAKEELKEVVKFLKNPQSFERLGAGIPKGVLLSGPPGTGKTLFARAVAGEAKRPFIRVSGSQFVELLVGLGAARVRELFDKARKEKPCIIFIDEIDSVARARSGGGNMSGVNDEREQTLNQLLTEMDGFKSDTGIVVIAATNRIDILDPALIRPGRFDRQITINLPTVKDREAILKVHAKGKTFDSSISFGEIAQQTIGFSGADLANLLNEAAILAVRRKKTAISMNEIATTIDRIILGVEGRNSLRIRGRQLTAFHEVGHAVMASILNPEQDIQKLTIIPRGNTQGVTNLAPSAIQYPSRETFIRQILIALSGRAVEEIVFGTSECTVGAQEDIAQLTRALRGIVVRYAMTRLQELKQESQRRNLSFLGSDAKEEINNIVDNFSTNFVDVAYQQVYLFLTFLRPMIERITDELLAYEELDGKVLRVLTKEFLFNTKKKNSNIVLDSRSAALFEMLFPEMYTSFEMEKQINESLKKVKEIIKDLKSKPKN
jgi:cell division protease FtsH